MNALVAGGDSWSEEVSIIHKQRSRINTFLVDLMSYS
jgi:hypothetical protein